VSGASARVSSATALSEPERRRFSRAAWRTREPKRRAAKKNSGTTTSAASVSFRESSRRATKKKLFPAPVRHG